MTTDEEDLVKKFIYEVGRSPILLTLALNLIMSYELNLHQKVNLKKSLMRHNPFSHYDLNDLTELNSRNLLNQYFNTNYMSDICASWQIRVTLHEIRNLVGMNENVFCVVEIGEQKFTTKERHIEKLQFYNADDGVSFLLYTIMVLQRNDSKSIIFFIDIFSPN